MVHQTQQGYLLMPLISAIQVERNGSYYFFTAPDYRFALDTLNLVYQANLAVAGSQNYVYFSGLNIKDCLYQYGFRREPNQAGKEKADFEFIPGIGIVSDRSGMTSAEMEANQLRLWFVNGIALDDHIAGLCGKPAATATPAAPQPIAADRPPEPTSFSAPEPAPKPVAGCAERSGPGYHIVQPKETLMSISRQYKVPLSSLVAWNQLSNPNVLEVCQRIYVADPKTVALPASKDPVPAPPATAPAEPLSLTVHTVQAGESVASIARLYGYSEQQFRQVNGFPAAGAIVIYPGQKLLLDNRAKPAAQPAQPAVQPPQTVPPPTQPAPQPGTQVINHPGLKQPAPPGTQPAIQPAIQPAATTPPPTTEPAPAKVTYYQEYVVQQGETLNSIAIKFKTNVQELTLLNNKEPNETLIAGQRLLIPKQ